MRRSYTPALAALVCGLVVHGSVLFADHPLTDEHVYLAAFEAARSGTALHEGWFYPETTARLGGEALRLGLPPLALMGGIRALNLLGTAFTLGTVGAALGGWRAILLAVLGMWLWGPPSRGIAVGNVSGLLTGLILLAVVARATPSRTLALSVGLLLKPLSLGVALSRGRWVAAVVSALVVCAYLDTPHRSDFPNRLATSNAALGRAISELVPALPWQLVSGAALLAAATWARGRWGRALACSWLALPIAWEHSTIVVLPALALAWSRASDEADLRARSMHQVLCGLSALVMHNAAFYGLGDGPAIASGLLGLVPSLAVLYAGWRS